MRSLIALKCTSCGAPAADCVAICPYCHKATGFASLSGTRGIEISDAGSMHIRDGAHLKIGVSEGGGACPFCGADAEAGTKVCSFCNAKLVIEKMRIAKLVIAGGKMTIGGGGSVEIVGRQRRKIHRAAANDELAALKAEVMDGDDPDFEDAAGKRPLHYAAAAGALSTAQWLLSIGANPNTRDESGKTPLQLARGEGHENLVDLLAMYASG
jgi:hypothetical protein